MVEGSHLDLFLLIDLLYYSKNNHYANYAAKFLELILWREIMILLYNIPFQISEEALQMEIINFVFII